MIGSKVLVTGVGGGVALFALQFAVALGAEVYVTSSSRSKIEKAKALGAIGGVNYTKGSQSAFFFRSSSHLSLLRVRTFISSSSSSPLKMTGPKSW
jgi:NADPH:quinone reductase-like Zn-dependent oxidoreductase